MIKYIFLLAMLFPISAYADNAQKIAEAKAFIKEVLKDPESARFDDLKVFINKEHESFRDLRVYRGMTPVWTVCGWVNSKNSYGGYGEEHFYMYLKLENESSYIFLAGSKLKFLTDDETADLEYFCG